MGRSRHDSLVAETLRGVFSSHQLQGFPGTSAKLPIIALSRDAFRGRPSSSRRSQATSCSSLPASVCRSRMYARCVSCKGEEMFVPRCHYVAFQSSSSDLFGTSGWPSCGASTDVTVSLYFKKSFLKQRLPSPTVDSLCGVLCLARCQSSPRSCDCLII